MIMALCGLPRRQRPDNPALDEVSVRVSAGSKVPQQNLPDAPRPRAQRSRDDVCTFARIRSRESADILKDALVAQQPRQDRRQRVTVMLVDNLSKKRWRQKRKAERG